MPVIMGGLALASGVMGAFGSAGSAKAQAIAQKMQQDQQNFENKLQNEAQNRNILRQWQAQQQLNIQLEKAANQQYATQSVYLRRNYQNTASLQSRQTKAATDSYLASMSARGISQDSASAKAMLRQAQRQSQLDSLAASASYEAGKRSLKAQEENILSQRVLGGPQQQVFIPTTGGIVDASASALTTGLIQAGLGAASATFGSAMENVRNDGSANWFGGLNALFGKKP